MANFPVAPYLTEETLYRMYDFFWLKKSVYDVNPAAYQKMIERINNSPRTRGTGGVQLCECPDPVSKTQSQAANAGNKCISIVCKNIKYGFECPPLCGELCKNNVLTNDLCVKTVTQIRSAGTRGRGLFAIREIQNGTDIVEIKGVLGLATELPSSFCFQVGTKLMGPPGSDVEVLYLNTEQRGNETRFLNTGCKPNARIVEKVVGGEMRAYLKAEARIPKDAEILIKYPPKFMKNMKCTTEGCNGKNCWIKRANDQNEDGDDGNADGGKTSGKKRKNEDCEGRVTRNKRAKQEEETGQRYQFMELTNERQARSVHQDFERGGSSRMPVERMERFLAVQPEGLAAHGLGPLFGFSHNAAAGVRMPKTVTIHEPRANVPESEPEDEEDDLVGDSGQDKVTTEERQMEEVEEEESMEEEEGAGQQSDEEGSVDELNTSNELGL